jgi:hypothetical protein
MLLCCALFLCCCSSHQAATGFPISLCAPFPHVLGRRGGGTWFAVRHGLMVSGLPPQLPRRPSVWGPLSVTGVRPSAPCLLSLGRHVLPMPMPKANAHPAYNSNSIVLIVATGDVPVRASRGPAPWRNPTAAAHDRTKHKVALLVTAYPKRQLADVWSKTRPPYGIPAPLSAARSTSITAHKTIAGMPWMESTLIG